MKVQQNAVLIPVQTFAQAYYLLTVPKIDEAAIRSSYVRGEALLGQELKKAQENLKTRMNV